MSQSIPFKPRGSYVLDPIILDRLQAAGDTVDGVEPGGGQGDLEESEDNYL